MIFVVLPAYNEEPALRELLPALGEVMVDRGLEYEVVVVDDGSSDETAKVAQRMQDQMPLHLLQHNTNRGLAAALRTGLSYVRERAEDSDVIVTMDSDNSHVPGLILAMVRKIREGADVVIASRFQPGSRVVGVPWHRQLLSWGASVLLRIILPISGVRDYTCGYRAYRGLVLRKAFEQYGEQLISQQGFSCMVDLLLRISTMPVVITEVPMILRYDLKPSVSKMNVGATILETLKLIIRRRLGMK